MLQSLPSLLATVLSVLYSRFNLGERINYYILLIIDYDYD